MKKKYSVISKKAQELNSVFNDKIEHRKKHATCGFTLLELSISLLIIGFIVSALSYGSALVKQASIRAVITEVRALSTALGNFKMLYGTVPGDLSNATSYWPAVAGTQTANLTNGNGNGLIDGTEYNYALQMLSSASLIQYNLLNAVNHPSKYSSYASYKLFNHNSTSSVAVYGRSGLGNVLDLANISGTTFNGAVTSQDAYNIDLKMDDGLLYSGIIYTAKGSNYTGANYCTTLTTTTYASTAAIAATDSFNFSDTSSTCWMFFWIVDAIN
jgi:prepilin-type N-terminal cleavage/methylation domain-containing protein